jgi:hypothetical protein
MSLIAAEVTLATIENMLHMRNGPFQEHNRIRDVVSFSFTDPNFRRYILIRTGTGDDESLNYSASE